MSGEPRTGLERFGDALAWLFGVGLVITVYEVVMRYVFKSPTSWVHETTTTLCAMCFAIGGGHAMVRNEHMRVSTWVDRLSGTGRAACEWLSVACGAVYLGGLGWGTWRQARESVWRFDEGHWLPEPMPGPPGWPLPALVKAALLLGTLLFLAALLRHALRLARGTAGPR
jgi:TRAP-type C4-dicarboxylate transport system permease small subunit